MRMQVFTLPLLLSALPLPADGGAGEKGHSLPVPLVAHPVPPWLEEGPPGEGSGASFEDRVMEIVNEERLLNGGLAPLKRVGTLDASSETHSSNMAVRNFFSHCDLDTGSQPWDRMNAAGYTGFTFAAENILAGASTPQSAMAQWMASPGHAANILSTGVREIGIGHVFQSTDTGNVRVNLTPDCTVDQLNQGPYFHYWTQNFGMRPSVYPVVIDREAYETPDRDVDLYLYGAGWAASMRLRNEAGAFTPWQPFATDVPWQLSAGGGVKTVEVQIASGPGGTGTVRTASDTIVLAGGADQIFTDGFESGNTAAWSGTVP